jgi:hypothetical protein
VVTGVGTILSVCELVVLTQWPVARERGVCSFFVVGGDRECEITRITD